MKTSRVLRMLRTGQTMALPRRTHLKLDVDVDAWVRVMGATAAYYGGRSNAVYAAEVTTPLGREVAYRALDLYWRDTAQGRVTIELGFKVFPAVDYGTLARLVRQLYLALRRAGGAPALRPERPSPRACRGWCVSERWERTPILACGFARPFHPWDAGERCVHCNRTRREALLDGFWSMDDGACPPCRVKWLAHFKAAPTRAK